MFRLTLHLLPSKHGISWRSPADLARSAVRNHVSRGDRRLGHVAIALSGPDGEVLTGMTDDGMDSLGRLLRGHGLEVLLAGFPGRMERAEDLRAELARKRGGPRHGAISWQLSEAAYARTARYLQEYRERGVDRIYGLPHRPRFGEGAGCSAFAVSVADVAGVMTEDLHRAWGYRLHLPHELVGGPGKRVPLRRLLTDDAPWAGREGVPLHFYDPDTMHAWLVRELGHRGVSESTLTLDAREWAVPDEPIWLD
ncbi:MAG: hypothetical protein EP330_03690 [Deltaproteobacteria bacterium]|nr:MAG: hypothetical protein EP330_03690 [Deltaproteobacteria bacterium]